MSDTPISKTNEQGEFPWEKLTHNCPKCGCKDLPLLDSKPPGLTYIKCPEGCGTWLRGKPDYTKIFPDRAS